MMIDSYVDLFGSAVKLLWYTLGLCIWLYVCFNVVKGLYTYDSTDNGKKRSGMAVHVDDKTGCHYISTMFGGPTPRLDKNGKQICIGHEEKK